MKSLKAFSFAVFQFVLAFILVAISSWLEKSEFHSCLIAVIFGPVSMIVGILLMMGGGMMLIMCLFEEKENIPF